MKSFVVPVGGSKLQRIFSAFSPVEGNDFLTFNQNLGDSASLSCFLRVLQSLSLATLLSTNGMLKLLMIEWISDQLNSYKY